MEKEPPNIADEAAKCVQKFKLLTQQLQGLEVKSQSLKDSPLETGEKLEPDVDPNDLDISTESLKDAWARFNVWTSNIGALQRGRASLDYRLRHADVKEEVLRLLRHLNVTLSHLFDIVSGTRQQEIWSSTDEIFTFLEGEFTDTDSDDDTDEDLSSNFRSTSSAPREPLSPQRITESSELSLSLSEALSGLFQLSMFIHKSTRRNKFSSFPADRSSPETQVDIRHVYDRFPFASQNQELLDRLGKANARRRQWLLYKKRHREKLARQTVLAEVDSEHANEAARGSKLAISTAAGAGDHGENSKPGTPLSPSAQSVGFKSERTGLSSTVASTFYAVPGLVPDEEDERSEAGYSETTYSESVKGDSEMTTSYVPQPPAESANGNPFECPYCFQIVSITGRTSWAKHVHSDLASYVCTQEGCTHPPFESRHQWFSHELEVHRFQWPCEACPAILPSAKSFQKHMKQSHAHLVPSSSSLQSLTSRVGRPIQEIPATACPLCDYNEILKQRRRHSASTTDSFPTDDAEPITLRLKTFRRHLGRHLEQLALFVLPKNELMEMPPDLAESVDIESSEKQDLDEEEEGSGTEDHAVLTGEEQEDDSQSATATKNEPEDELHMVDLSSLTLNAEALTDDSLESAPELAMGWLPPMNFTPPAADFEQEDVDLIPRREDSMFGGDLFTPGWVRGYGSEKEGFCGRCEPGVWLNIDDGSYMQNLVYKHGIDVSGIPLPRPSSMRREGKDWMGFCEACQGWRPIRATEKGWNWFRHCVKAHSPDRGKGHSGTVRRQEVEQSTGGANISTQESSDETEGINTLIQHMRGGSGKFASMLSRALHSAVRGDGKRLIFSYNDHNGWSFLHHAADLDYHDVIDIVFEEESARDELLERRTPNGETALMLAALQGNVETVKVLIKHSAQLDSVSNDGQTALDYAATAGCKEACKLLIDAGADILKSKTFCKLHRRQTPSTTEAQLTDDSPPQADDDRSTWTPLMAASFAGDLPTVEHCLSTGVDIEATSIPKGETALMLAASNGHTHILRYLLRKGANIDATNAKGWTTLMLAARSENEEVITLLTSHGADVNHSSPDHWTALAEATQRGNHFIMKQLLACKADTETRSMHDWTPLMHAAFVGDIVGVELLIDAGADTDVVSQHDESALLLAAAGRHEEVCRVLLDAGCATEPGWVREDAVLEEEEGESKEVTRGWTPMMLACQNGLESVVGLLLERGVDMRPKSPYGKTAREIAEENGMGRIVELLGWWSGGRLR